MRLHSLTATQPQDIHKFLLWFSQRFTNAQSLPISMLYGGKRISGIPAAWFPAMVLRKLDANLEDRIYTGMDPETCLEIRVEATVYKDYPAVEWTTWLTNKGHAPSPVISEFYGMDDVIDGEQPVIHHCNGDFCNPDGYTTEETSLSPGNSLRFAPTGGRPCDQAFPYYRMQFQGFCTTMAVGWPAQWFASFAGSPDGVAVRAGQERVHMTLQPGESIRSPRMMIMFSLGDTMKATNLWRRWYLDHVLPRPDGSALQPMLTCAATDGGEEFTNATEENQIRYIHDFRNRDIHPDIWWIDARLVSMHPFNRSSAMVFNGQLAERPLALSQRVQAVADACKEEDTELLVWFEPERVHPGTMFATEHPEWVLYRKNPPAIPLDTIHSIHMDGLLNLGDPACLAWVTDYMCDYIKKNGIKVYRQDFNFEPLPYWVEHEATDRIGAIENHHVQGYLSYWDAILERNPGLWIDSCAGGGRRNDLETMRRSVPLHYTDSSYGIHAIKQSFHHTLYTWLPYFKEFSFSWDEYPIDRFDSVADRFGLYNAFAPCMFIIPDIRRDDYDYGLYREMVALWRKAAPLLLYGDYYPLTAYSKSTSNWMVRQFQQRDASMGLIQSIRHRECEQESITVRLYSLNSNCFYHFENPETGVCFDLSGKVLSEDGITFVQPKRSGAVWFYHAIE